MNNALGGLINIDQDVEDVFSLSVVLSPLDVVTAAINEVLKSGKIFLDGVQLGLDVIGGAAAWYDAARAPRSSQELVLCR